MSKLMMNNDVQIILKKYFFNCPCSNFPLDFLNLNFVVIFSNEKIKLS